MAVHSAYVGGRAAAPTDALESAVAWALAGHGVALATVIPTSGSSPRPAGSQLAIRDDLQLVGSVSAGCVESEVIRAARAAITDGEPRLLAFGVAADDAVYANGLACGGRIEVRIEAVGDHVDVLEQILADRRARRAVCLVDQLPAGARRRVEPTAGVPAGALAEAIRGAVATEAALTVEDQGTRWFVHPFVPRRRMVIVGAVHIAQELAPMAAACGYEVIVVDPRGAFASPERFPGARLMPQWPDTALDELSLDPRSAVVVLTHDPKLDDPALAAALASDVCYLGALGSRRTHQKRLARLADAGISSADLARISGPIGLAIGARSPAEIAVSILAEVTQRVRTCTA